MSQQRLLRFVLFSLQLTPRFSPTRWFSSTSSSLWSSRAKAPKGRPASCCRRPPFSRRSIPSLFCPSLPTTSPAPPASRPPSSTPPSVPTPSTPRSTTPKPSLSSSLPSTYKYSQRYLQDSFLCIICIHKEFIFCTSTNKMLV